MPTWPSGTKAGTSNVDNGSDLIRLARPDIKQNIDNTNAIIDTFDPSGASNQDLLTYNSSTTKFEPTSSIGLSTTLVEFDSGMPYINNLSRDDYSGGFTIVGGNAIGLTAGTSGSRSTLTFPAGTYQIGTAETFYYGQHGVPVNFSLSFKLKKDSDESDILEESTTSSSFYFRRYYWYSIVTFASNTEVYVETNRSQPNSNDYDHTPLLINRLA